jgi:glycogen phosphorylase
MKNIQMFTVCPSVPEKLRFLETLSHNMWWCWEDKATSLFRRIDPQVWKNVDNNPIKLLSAVPQSRLEALANDEAFLAQLEQVQDRFEEDMATSGKDGNKPHVCYFSLEYGIHETLRIYSGGLGALAGDHLKSASDLRVPLIAVGLMYRQGYFRQYLDSDGMQQESYPENEVHMMPIEKVTDANGNDLTVSVDLPEGPLQAAVWRLQVGRISLLLLDANVPTNPHELRGITAQLYGGDKKNRLRQELLLGIGGFRALRALDIDPVVCHMNEGHAAFLSMARMEYLTKHHGCTFEQALEIVPRTSVFTTHTPVPAGNEYFAVEMLRPHLEAALKDSGLDINALLHMANPANQPSGT